jgi:hypothetical protein
MNEQPSLFDQPPYQRHSETSHRAAEQIASEAANLREQVYRYIASRGIDGATDAEVQEALQMAGNTQRPRRIELLRAKRIRLAVIRRRTPSGRYADVWVACEGRAL